MTAPQNIEDSNASTSSGTTAPSLPIEVPPLKDEFSQKFMQTFANALAEKFSEQITEQLAKAKEEIEKKEEEERKAAEDAEAEEENKEEETEDDEPKAIRTEDMKEELKRIDSIWVKNSEGTLTRQFADWDDKRPLRDDDEFIPDEHGTWVLVLRRVFEDDNRRVRKMKLDIKSPLIKKILKDVYNEAAMESEKASISWPNDTLFVHREEVKAAAKKEGELAEKHIGVLMKLLEEEYVGRLRDIRNLIPKGAVTYDTLSEVYRVGDLVVDSQDDFERIYRITDANFYENDWDKEYYYEVQREYVDWDGKQFGTVAKCTSFTISKFEGVKYLSDLQEVPLKYHRDADGIKERLLARGKKFATLCRGQHFKHFSGNCMAFFLSDEDGEENSRQRHKPAVLSSRVMIDTVTFNRKVTQHQIYVSNMDDELVDGELTEEHLLMTIYKVPAFAFHTKMFYTIPICGITEIEFNPSVFTNLVLPAAHKELVRVLVENLTKEDSTFDDFVSGKGKGLVSVLHGPPGVGKTMTAEAVAEYTKRPLYIVGSGDLGHSAGNMKLGYVLDLAKTFNAVLLIDEADVFLEQRTTGDLERNALVSIFLRQLEYYEGILFLTTNRVGTFDEAFYSRIHISLCYENLNRNSREQVWRNFGKTMPADKIALSDSDYRVLSGTPLNGRQIKNVFRTAQALASDKGVPVSLEHLNTVLEVMTSFDLAKAKASKGVEV